MQFCPWYPLVDAAAHAPASEGVLQLRVADGLIDYPRGKSAMVWYQHAADLQVAAAALAARRAGEDLLCRHCEGDASLYARVLGDFERRFGAAPGAA